MHSHDHPQVFQETSLTRFSRLLIWTIFLGSLLVLSTDTAQALQGGEGEITPTPDGFDKYMVFMANGASFPPPPGLPPNPWPGYLFHTLVMKRTNAEILQHRAEAIVFYIARFGLDPDAPENAGRLALEMTYVLPQKGYRAYTISGESVPSSGWVVHDGGWILIVTDPAGMTLGGDFAGLQVPSGTVFLYGDYYIATQRSSETGNPDPIIIHYEAHEPIIADQFGTVSFRCDLLSQEFGTGIAQGSQYGVQLPDGRVQNITRNILTFPGNPTPPPLEP